MIHKYILANRAPTQSSNYSVIHYITGTHYHYLTPSVMSWVLSITEYTVFCVGAAAVWEVTAVDVALGVVIHTPVRVRSWDT